MSDFEIVVQITIRALSYAVCGFGIGIIIGRAQVGASHRKKCAELIRKARRLARRPNQTAHIQDVTS